MKGGSSEWIEAIGDMTWKIRATCGAALTLALVLTGGAALGAKQPDPKDRAAVLQTLLDCRTMTDSQKRLACFDAAVGQLDSATAKGDVVVVDREQIRSMKRQAFGFTLPSLSALTGNKPDAVDTKIELGVSALAYGADGHVLYTFDDGSVWRQFDQSESGRTPKKGMKAEISRGVMGSYFMSLAGAPGVRVQRQR